MPIHGLASCTSELTDDFLNEKHIDKIIDENHLKYDLKTFAERSKKFRTGPKAFCWSIYGNAVAVQMHEIRNIKNFSIPMNTFQDLVNNKCNFIYGN